MQQSFLDRYEPNSANKTAEEAKEEAEEEPEDKPKDDEKEEVKKTNLKYDENLAFEGSWTCIYNKDNSITEKLSLKDDGKTFYWRSSIKLTELAPGYMYYNDTIFVIYDNGTKLKFANNVFNECTREE